MNLATTAPDPTKALADQQWSPLTTDNISSQSDRGNNDDDDDDYDDDNNINININMNNTT